MSKRSLKRYEINMTVAKEMAQLSTCDRAHVGAVVYNPANHRIEGMGYNGSLPDHPHCDDAGHLLIEGHCVRTRHAEQNAIKQSRETKGCILFVTHFPCVNCVKEVIDAEISKVVYLQGYRILPESTGMLDFAGIKYQLYDEFMTEILIQNN